MRTTLALRFTPRHRVRRVFAVLAAGMTALAPLVASACPVCATREGGGPLGTVALGALIVAPWFAAVGFAFWIRRRFQEEAVAVSLDQQDRRPS